MPNVYVVQYVPGISTERARNFGSLVTIFRPHDQDIGGCAEMYIKAEQALQTACPGDYLLPIGSPVLIGLSTAAIMEKTRKRFKFLVWDNREKEYYPKDWVPTRRAIVKEPDRDRF